MLLILISLGPFYDVINHTKILRFTSQQYKKLLQDIRKYYYLESAQQKENKLGYTQLEKKMSKTTFQTAIAVANSMLGTSLLVLPINFLNQGIIQSGIASIIMSVVMGTTATIIGRLVSGKQKQFYKVVKSEMSIRWSQIMAIQGAILSILVGCIVFVLATKIFYQIFQQFSTTIQSMGQQLFKTCLLIIFIPLCLLNSLEVIVKFGFVNMILIWVYILTLTFSFFLNIKKIESEVFQIKGLSLTKIQFVLSVQGFIFICHPSLDSILKQNKKSQTNGKAVIGGYFISCFIISLCGILGALAIYKKQTKSQHNIIEYFKGTWQYLVLSVSVSLYLLILFPLFPFVTRAQIYQILPERFKENSVKTHKILKLVFILIFSALCQFFTWMRTGPAHIMGFVTSIVCFYICYLLPLVIKIKLIRKTTESDQITSSSSLIQSGQYLQISAIKVTDVKILPSYDKNTAYIYQVLFIAILCFGTVLIIGEIWYLIDHLIST